MNRHCKEGFGTLSLPAHTLKKKGFAYYENLCGTTKRQR